MQALSRTPHRIADERQKSLEHWLMVRKLKVEDLPPVAVKDRLRPASARSGHLHMPDPEPRPVSPENRYMPPTLGIDLIGLDPEVSDWLFEDDRPWLL